MKPWISSPLGKAHSPVMLPDIPIARCVCYHPEKLSTWRVPRCEHCQWWITDEVCWNCWSGVYHTDSVFVIVTMMLFHWSSIRSMVDVNWWMFPWALQLYNASNMMTKSISEVCRTESFLVVYPARGVVPDCAMRRDNGRVSANEILLRQDIYWTCAYLPG